MKVFTNGCFDILHRGHVELLKYCASLGEVIVGLNSDESVARLKGVTRPFVGVDDRKILLESIKFVKSVHVFHEDTPYELIKTLRPDLIVKGGDYQPQEVAGFDLCEVRIFNFLEDYSSSKLISRLSEIRVNKLEQ